MDRETRNILNSKQSGLYSSVQPSKDRMLDGQIVVGVGENKQPVISYKKDGRMYKTNLSSDGNVYVDKTLTTNTLQYKYKFIDYRVFKHSFTDDLPATKIYIPWQGTGEQTTILNSTSGYLSPFKMTCHKLFFRTPAMDTAATDIVFGIEKIDSGDTSIDSVCTYDATATWSDNTNIIINKSDWSATPTIEVGDLAGISLQADNANIVTSEKHFHITSVWRVEVVV